MGRNGGSGDQRRAPGGKTGCGSGKIAHRTVAKPSQAAVLDAKSSRHGEYTGPQESQMICCLSLGSVLSPLYGDGAGFERWRIVHRLADVAMAAIPLKTSRKRELSLFGFVSEFTAPAQKQTSASAQSQTPTRISPQLRLRQMASECAKPSLTGQTLLVICPPRRFHVRPVRLRRSSERRPLHGLGA
jgi:hypothetical protein